ncbi:hypothetical protein ACQP3J_31675, partial [Escherichia coli]
NTKVDTCLPNFPKVMDILMCEEMLDEEAELGPFYTVDFTGRNSTFSLNDSSFPPYPKCMSIEMYVNHQ